MIESAIERSVGRWCKSQGILFIKLSLPAGIPDRMVLIPGGSVLFLEFKTPNGRVGNLQSWWIAKLTGLGFSASVARSVDEAKAIILTEMNK